VSESGRCDAGVEGVHEDCCLHDLPYGAKHAPGQVCCWCGDLFLARYDTKQHGEYEPGISTTQRLKREAAGRKEERLKEKERKQFREDYGAEPYF